MLTVLLTIKQLDYALLVMLLVVLSSILILLASLFLKLLLAITQMNGNCKLVSTSVLLLYANSAQLMETSV
jgi:hypothetical protein